MGWEFRLSLVCEHTLMYETMLAPITVGQGLPASSHHTEPENGQVFVADTGHQEVSEVGRVLLGDQILRIHGLSGVLQLVLREATRASRVVDGSQLLDAAVYTVRSMHRGR